MAASEGDPDFGQCIVGGQESMAVTRTVQYGGNVVCTIEEEHSLIEDDDEEDDIPTSSNAAAPNPYFSQQIEGETRVKDNKPEGALWNDQGYVSRMSSSSGGSSSSRNSRNSSSSQDDITDNAVDGASLAIGATTRVIEGMTNRHSATLISTPPEHVLQPNNTSSNTIDNNSSNQNSSVHLTHFEEGYIVDHDNNNSSNNNSGHHTGVTSDRHNSQQHHEIYIENDLFTLFNLCLTCRAFYDQAIRLLWRQRTLSTAHELKGFYHTMTRSLALATRPKDSTNQQQPREIEAALRIKSLTLLDMGLFDVSESFMSVPWASTASSATSPSFTTKIWFLVVQMEEEEEEDIRHIATFVIAHFDPYHLSSDLDSTSNLVRWDQDTAAAASGSKNASTSSSSPSSALSPGRERASWAAGYSSAYGYDNAFWPSFSSSSSASTSQWAAAAAVAASSPSFRTHVRQKTSSIYSDIISPRLLHMVAGYCHALTDLTICIQSSELSLSAPGENSTATSTASTSVRRQPTITFSFLAGGLPSLKRLTLAGVVCDSDQNKTGSELLAFARTIQPLETLNIRSCQGISDETLMVLAERSGATLERLDFQGMDFQQTEQLTKVMKSFVAHCPNLASLTLSCMASLDLDESLQAFVDCDSRLKELQILGHDHMVAQQPQPQPEPQQQAMNGEEDADNGQQQQAQDGMQSVTTMCHLSDHVLLGLARLSHLARLTLYCTGMTDLAMIRFLSRAPCLEDLVLHEPTPVLHLPQLHSLTHYLFSHALSTSTSTTSLPSTTTTTTGATNSVADEPTEVTTQTSTSDTPAPPPAAQQPSEQPNIAATAAVPFEYTSASFLYLILNRRFRRRLSSLFIKISIETAQDWISQPVFQASGLASCLYQYQNAHSGEPAVVLIWKP
ncbi:hypothetical protein BGZ73_002026 [Actinomortierella ambigua]|nr:hypothetical protein BGZ73_002026 [Actinomortierella ambigua]